MSPRQKTYYFSLWKQVCIKQGWAHLSAAAKDERRKELHAQLRVPESSTKFTNQDFNRFKAACLAIITGQRNDAAHGAKRVDEDDARRQLLWRIREDATAGGLNDEYIASISRDLNFLGCWEELDLASLTNLRNTIHNRAVRKMRDTGGRELTQPIKATPRPSTRSYTLDPERRHTRQPATTVDIPF